MLFLLKCSPTNFSIPPGFCLQQVITGLSWWWFSLSLLPSTLINWNFSRRKVAPSFIYLLGYLFTSDGLVNIYFTLWTWIQSYYYLIYCSSHLNFGHRKIFGVGSWNLPKHLYDSVCLSDHVFTFWQGGASGHLLFPSLGPGINFRLFFNE